MNVYKWHALIAHWNYLSYFQGLWGFIDESIMRIEKKYFKSTKEGMISLRWNDGESFMGKLTFALVFYRRKEETHSVKKV